VAHELPLTDRLARLQKLLTSLTGSHSFECTQYLYDVCKDNHERKRAALAYLDPEKALYALDSYAWNPPQLPTPFLNVTLKPGVYGGTVINESGLRSNTTVKDKADGVIRVVITGGSVAFGSGAPSNDTTVGGYLQERLGVDYEVLTFACPAWSSTHERIAIENRISVLQPDIVISITGFNDVFWGMIGHDVMQFRTYKDHHWWTQLLSLNKLANIAVMDPVKVKEGSAVRGDVISSFCRNAMISDFALDAIDCTFLVALQPSITEMQRPMTYRECEISESKWNEGTAKYLSLCFDGFRKGLEEHNVATIDLTPIFDLCDDEVFIDQCHTGDRGNLIIAKTLAEHVLRVTPIAPEDEPLSDS